jgi:hypothetical protein
MRPVNNRGSAIIVTWRWCNGPAELLHRWSLHFYASETASARRIDLRLGALLELESMRMLWALSVKVETGRERSTDPPGRWPCASDMMSRLRSLLPGRDYIGAGSCVPPESQVLSGRMA